MSVIKYKDKETLPELFACTHCESSDAMRVYKKTAQDGTVFHDAHCFSCGIDEPNPPGFINTRSTLYGKGKLGTQSIPNIEKQTNFPRSSFSTPVVDVDYSLESVLEDFKTYPIRSLPERGITKEVCERYGVRVSLSPTDGVTTVTHKYPYYKKDKLTGYKERVVKDKIIYSKGDCKEASLFGTHCFKSGGKNLYITEGECFKPDAEVLTPEGWVSFKDLGEQKVAQYNTDGTSSFVAPLAKIKKPFKGSLVKHTVRGYTSITTPEHNLVALDYKGRLVKHKANAVPSKTNTIPRVSEIDGTGIGLDKDQIALTLAVCADSKIDIRKTVDNYVHFGLKKERKVTRLLGILKRLGIENTLNVNGDRTYISFTSPDFIVDKKLPKSWIGNATLEERRFILKELVHWDGNSVYDRDQTEFSSKHYTEATWVQTIAHTAGMCSTIMKRSNKHGEWYKVSILHNKTTSSWQSMKTVDEEYSGDVYCVTVPTGMIMVRMNDHISISGNCDALALYQTLTSLSNLDNYDPAVVSLSHGSASAAKDISLDFDFVNSFDKITLCFDMDDAGQAAAEDACKLLAGKVYIAKYAKKDANEMLLEGLAEELKWDVLKHAKQYMPDNIVNYLDCWDRYKEGKNQHCYYWPDSWKFMNDMTYGIRLGELVTVTAGSGMGKSQILREMKDHFYRTTDFKMADIALEEDVGDSIAGMMSLYLNKRITLPDVKVTEAEEREAFDFYFKTNRWTGYDYFGGLDDDNLFSKIRFLAATGHKLIFLDHLSIIVSEFAAEGGERERIDTIMTKLAKMVKELNITIILVVHLRKSDGKSFEEGHVPTLDDLRGSGSLKQLSWMVIALSRNQQHSNKFCANTTEITVLKCRFTGRTGTADYLNFNDQTGRMVAVPKPDDYRPSKKNNFKPNFNSNSQY